MKIKEITCQKSRTILVEKLLGRDKYRKITIGMTADLQTNEEYENPLMAYDLLSEQIDKAIEAEIIKLNELIKK